VFGGTADNILPNDLYWYVLRVIAVDVQLKYTVTDRSSINKINLG
jgi:hypothetical protein